MANSLKLKTKFLFLPNDDKLNNKELMVNCYSNMGIVYDALSDYKKAIEYFNKELIAFLIYQTNLFVRHCL